MTYEAYEEPALRAMDEIAAEARRRWPDIERVALLHRVGDLALSEPSVAVVVSSPASRRGVRRRALLHRHAERDRADLEAGALDGRVRLGVERASHPAGSTTLAVGLGTHVAFLLFAVLASALGIAVVLLRNRRPTSMEHSIDEFERGLRALAPETSRRAPSTGE